MKQYVFTFEQGNANMRQLLGGKGANLAEMTGLGLPVPPGFTISTEACNNYYENDKTLDEEITAQAMAAAQSENAHWRTASIMRHLPSARWLPSCQAPAWPPAERPPPAGASLR